MTITKTERLILREYVKSDLDGLYAILSDAENMRYYPAPYDEQGTRRWLDWCTDCYQKYGFGLFAIELKETGYEFRVLSAIKKYFSYDEFMINSFLDTAVKKVERRDKKGSTGLLLGYKNADVKRRVNEFMPKRRLALLDVDFISPQHRLVTWDFMLRMRLLKKKVYVWTANDEKIIKKLLTKGVDGIITDVPDKALALRDAYYKRKDH